MSLKSGAFFRDCRIAKGWTAEDEAEALNKAFNPAIPFRASQVYEFEQGQNESRVIFAKCVEELFGFHHVPAAWYGLKSDKKPGAKS